MSRRLKPSSRAGGCFFVLFFGVFLTLSVTLGSVMIFHPEKGSGNIFVGMIVVGVFFMVGLGGVVFGLMRLMGKSLGTDKKLALENFPGAALPARILAVRKSNGYFNLKPRRSHRGQFLVLLFMSIVFIGVTSTMAYSKWVEGSHNAPPSWFLVIFIIACLALAWGAIFNFVRWIAVGEVGVDVDRVDVAPGESIEILVSLPGSYKIKEFIMQLVCQEKATYRQGTDTRTKEETVRKVPVCELTDLTARNNMVLANQTCVIPADAVPGFHARNNDITWMIEVKMVLDGKPDVNQLYPIRVLPGEILKEESRNIVRS